MKVLRPLSADAISESFLAQVPGHDAPRALRLLRPELSGDAARSERFLAEAKKLIGAQAPGLLKVHAAGRTPEGRAFAVTDAVEGDTLETRAGAALPADELADVGTRLAQGLAVAHAAGAVHGALAPRHVLLGLGGPCLDLTFASVERQGPASPEADARALGALVLRLGALEHDAAPSSAALRTALARADSALGVVAALDAVRPGAAADDAPARRPGEAVVLSQTVEEPDLTGQALGPYQLERVVGEGAMGRVYRATDARSGRVCAVKVLKVEHAHDTDVVRRFINEATAVNAIRNPHIVEAFAFGEEKTAAGQPRTLCVMELLEGQTLVDHLEKVGPLDLRTSAKVCLQLCRALGAAHRLGVVHRDVKPENVFLVARDGDPLFVKVLDFGVAKLLKPIGDLPQSGTVAGTVIGTPEYMAPEQATGQATDSRIDLWAVGVVLFELLTGRLPFSGNSFGRLVVSITTRPTPALPSKNPGGERIPRGLAAVVARCLQKRAEERYQTAEALAAALEPFAQGLWPEEPPEQPPPAPVAPAPEDDLAAVRPALWPRVGAAVLLAALLGAVAWLLLGR